MHELSIADSLVDAIDDVAAREGHVVVRAVHLRIGQRSGVSVSALRFAFDVSTDGTAAAGAVLMIEETAGRELELVAVEVADVGTDC